MAPRASSLGPGCGQQMGKEGRLLLSLSVLLCFAANNVQGQEDRWRRGSGGSPPGRRLFGYVTGAEPLVDGGVQAAAAVDPTLMMGSVPAPAPVPVPPPPVEFQSSVVRSSEVAVPPTLAEGPSLMWGARSPTHTHTWHCYQFTAQDKKRVWSGRTTGKQVCLSRKSDRTKYLFAAPGEQVPAGCDACDYGCCYKKITKIKKPKHSPAPVQPPLHSPAPVLPPLASSPDHHAEHHSSVPEPIIIQHPAEQPHHHVEHEKHEQHHEEHHHGEHEHEHEHGHEHHHGEEEVGEEEAEISPVDVGMSWVLLGSVGFVMCIFYLVNYPDDDIRRHSWNIISSTLALFMAVLTFSTVRFTLASLLELFYPVKATPQIFKVLGSYILFMAFYVTLQMIVAYVSGAVGDTEEVAWDKEAWVIAEPLSSRAGEKLDADTVATIERETIPLCKDAKQAVVTVDELLIFVRMSSEERDKREGRVQAYGLLFSHMTGFAAIAAGGTVQNMDCFMGSVGSESLTVLINLGAMIAIFKGFAILRETVSRADGMYDERDKLFDEQIHDCENDIAGLQLSFLTIQVVRYLITGYEGPGKAIFPDPEGNEEVEEGEGPIIHTAWSVLYLYLCGIGFAGLASVNVYLYSRVAEAEHDHEDHGEHANESGQQEQSHDMHHWIDQMLLKFMSIFTKMTSMGFGWCILWATKWAQNRSETLSQHAPMGSVPGLLLLSVFMTAGSAVGVLALDCLKDMLEKSTMGVSQMVEIIITGMSVLVGLSWESCFTVAEEVICEDLPFHVLMEILAGCATLCLIIPGWEKHIMIKVLRLEEMERQKAHHVNNQVLQEQIEAISGDGRASVRLSAPSYTAIPLQTEDTVELKAEIMEERPRPLPPTREEPRIANYDYVPQGVLDSLETKEQKLISRPGEVYMPDPRRGKEAKKVQVIAFDFPGSHEACDDLCRAHFLSNCFDPKQVLQIRPDASYQGYGGPDRGRFRNSEAAFHALKFWSRAQEFENLSGRDARIKAASLRGQEDETFAGYGEEWMAMLNVLNHKFKDKKAVLQDLLDTGDSYLLHHGRSSAGDDTLWSDGGDGEGLNWLGAQLMLIRDLRRREKTWTSYIEEHLDAETGTPHSQSSDERWLGVVKEAHDQLSAVLVARGLRDRAME